MCNYKDKFINKSIEKHNGIYDYSLVEYKNFDTKVKIICPIHGEFEQTPGNHLRYGCGKCGKKKGGEKQKSNTEEFIKKAIKIHGDKYDYSLVEYVSAKNKVKIICPEHGVFEQTPDGHLYNKGCSFCAGNIQYTKDEIIKKFKEKHDNKYDYSKVNYTGIFNKIKIICPIHGEFEQKAKGHLEGKGCNMCYGNIRLSTEKFIDKAKKIHGDLFDYSKVVYTNMKEKVEIICTKHGSFFVSPTCHISKRSGCPTCNSSSGERRISKWLKEKNINFVPQKTFVDCINPKTGKNLFYDFYIQSNNLLIEYDGEQHSRPMNFFGKIKSPKEEFAYLKFKDNIKTQYAIDRKIKLVRITHKEFKNIEERLHDIFFSESS